MVSGVAYGREVVEAHASGDLHVQGLEERGGCWASWDSSAIVGKEAAGNTAEHLLQFMVKARREWHSFQRLSGFELLMGGIVGDSEKMSWLKTLITGLGDDGGKVFLGLEEQSREDKGRVLEAIFAGLRSPVAQTGRLAPTVVFTDAYDWGGEGDLSLYESANALCSSIFMHRREATTRRAVDPWLDGAAPGVNTGVLGAVTLNLPRAALTSGEEGEFFDRVWNLTGLAVDGLEAKRLQLDAELKAGDMPATGSVVDSFDDFFGAVGVIGVNEALLNLVERGIGSMQGKVIAYKVLEAIKDRLEEKDKETGHRFCLIAEPTDGAAYRLAELDRVKYPEIKASGMGSPFYTSSTCLPVDYTDDLWDALEHQKKLQALYNGGTIFNIGLEKALPDARGCRTLARKIVEKTPLPCFAFSPSVSVGATGGGEEGYERMGYWYKPVSGMVAGEIEEVRLRKHFAVVNGW